MIEILRNRRNNNELALIHPAFMLRFAVMLRAIEDRGKRPRFQETWRDLAAQAKKFAAGLSTVQGSGPHTNQLLLGPGKFRPASFATHVLDDSANNPADPGNEWIAMLAVIAHKVQLQTGATWAQSKDSPLVQGKPHRIALEVAIAAGNEALVLELLNEHRGFDPLHVEVPGWRRLYGKDGDLDA